MRKVIDFQMKLGETAIANIKFDLRSRDDITKLLIGLQAIYCNRDVRDQVFQTLIKLIPSKIDINNGRNGMDLWKILVLGTLRLNCNWDYDKVHEMANNHCNLRLMLGHGLMDADYQYRLQTLKDNITLFTKEILDEINQIVVYFGHQIAGLKADDKLSGSCDSFVVETNVHFPTDIGILFDAIRKMIEMVMIVSGISNISLWRQGKKFIKNIKSLIRTANQIKQSSSKDPSKKAKKEQSIILAHQRIIDLAQFYVDRAMQTISSIQSTDLQLNANIMFIQGFIYHAERQIDQIRRRVINGESIPHAEKVFSIFEQHTEWISKGKAGVPVELGLKVCIVKDQLGFLLHHRVMRKETDDQIAVSIIEETRQRFPNFNGCSFDKGFHSPYTQEKLPEIIENVYLPRKGKLSAINKEIENSPAFKAARRKHSAVESSINALENHGLDRCPDHGINGFERYVALAVVARNIQILGDMLQKKDLKKLLRQEKKERIAA